MNWKCFVSKINIAIITLLIPCVVYASGFNVGTDWTNTVKNLYTTGTIVTSNVLGLTNTIDLVTDLRGKTWSIFTITKSVQPLGYYAVGDVDVPTYHWVSGAAPGTYVDNGGSVIVPIGGNGSQAWIFTLYGKVNMRHFGAYPGATQAINDAAIASAIAAMHSGTLYFPGPGVYDISDDIDIDITTRHINIEGDSRYSTFIMQTVGGTNGAVYYHGTGYGPTGTGQYRGSNGSWFEIKNIAIGSTTTNALKVHRAGQNGRLCDLWLFSAGTSSQTLNLDESGMTIGEMSNIRLGGGNMLGGDSDDPPELAELTFTTPLNFIKATSDTTWFTAELHFSNIQGHDGTSGDGVVIEDNAGLAALFNVTFNDCQIKSGQTYATGSSYTIKGASVQFSNCFSEASGITANMVKASGGADVRMTNCTGNNCGLLIDLSIAGTNKLYLANNHFYKVSKSGSPGSVVIVATGNTLDTAPSGFVSGTTWIGEDNYLLTAGVLSPINNTHSFTPGCTIGGAAYTLNSANGSYTKKGKLVEYSAFVEFKSPLGLGALTGAVVLTGLPFTTTTAQIGAAQPAVVVPGGLAAGVANVIAQPGVNSTDLGLYKVAAGTVAALQHTDLAAACTLFISGKYETNL